MAAPIDGNLYRKLADVEHVHGREGEEELLSTREMSWWWEGLDGGVLLRFIPCRAVHGGHGAARRVLVGGS